MTGPVLAVDAGTTGVTALLVTPEGRVASRGYSEFAQHYPRPGWVEHEPEEIWQAVLAACRAALGARPAGIAAPVAIGITNQRETAVAWRRDTLAAPRPAIVWQDRRGAEVCEELADAEPRVRELTGLRLDPYFTATSWRWLAAHEPQLWRDVAAGEIALGTVDSYVAARMTGGRLHVTDVSNASRTLLCGLDGRWSGELAALFDVPLDALPGIVASSGVVGTTDPAAFLGLELPIAGIAGDQQAALFGQACYTPGSSKCTYGTGSFVLVNTGTTPVRAPAGLLTTIAWDLGDGPVYAVEGAVFVTGAAVQWLRDGLGLIGSAAEIEGLARTVADSGGTVFVPALTGLGAPHWDPYARGLIAGISRGTTRAHLARATLEAIAFEVRDVVDVLTGAGVAVPELSVDGGASANDLLCQLQADQLGVAVRRPVVAETTALGAAFLAGLAVGVWSSTDQLRETWALDRTFAPVPGARDDGRYQRWQDAVARSRDWAR